MPQAANNHLATPSHVVDSVGTDRVVIRDLEVFAGYDPTVDDPKDRRMRKYDADGIARVVAKTRDMMNRGQRPKLILGHNPDEEDGIERPVIGDIINVKKIDIGGVPGIAGDVEMTREDFEAYLKSNRFPRRSAEIYADGFMSEVALLGSRTPARPIRDTKFSRGESRVEVEKFAREFAPSRFADPTPTSHVGGIGSVSIPSSSTRKSQMAKSTKRTYTADPDDDKEPTTLDEAKEQNRKLKAKLKAMCDEDAEKNSRSSDGTDDDDDVAAIRRERDTFARRLDEMHSALESTQSDLIREKYGRRLDADVASGFQVGDEKRKAAILDRVARASDPEDEYTFLKSMWSRGPVNTVIDTRGMRLVGSEGPETFARIEEEASTVAMARSQAEGKPEMFAHYCREEIEKRRKAG